MKDAKIQPTGAVQLYQTDWPQWKRRFLRYRTSIKLGVEEGAIQVSSLIYAMGNEAENTFSSFTFAAGERDEDFDTVLQKFEAHFIPKLNHIHERAVFNSSKQQESTETFVRHLYEMAERCNYGQEQKKENIRDSLVVGILDKDLSERLQLEEADLDTATQMVRQSELIKSQVKVQENGATNGATSSVVEEVYRRKPQNKRPPSASENSY
ncbi:hypothetical protein LOTGIDRAFT_170624 [Lottia gigantea]|uniref:Retrotransposon gag domain-containing protein n=1 Tax=Lottia gigantea TaxID=225164 RepID=V4B332_LOTGI|nr:hypothetical protein LOTGIDRAFT_170624 [Lottia gigantea]ESP04653.1 hypothetical protein LOTGIDRAFT_170624 [Lottia gigantea]